MELVALHKYQKDIKFYEQYTEELEDFVVELLVSYANEACLVDYLTGSGGTMPPEDFEFSAQDVANKLVSSGLDKDIIKNMMYNLLVDNNCLSIFDHPEDYA